MSDVIVVFDVGMLMVMDSFDAFRWSAQMVCK